MVWAIVGLLRYVSMSGDTITDEEFSQAVDIYPINITSAKEAFYYRAVFEELLLTDESAYTAYND